MIQFKDFVPKETKAAGFFSGADYEQLEETMQEVNAWVAQERVQVFNIETVLLPNIHNENGSADTHLRTSGDVSAYWHQVVPPSLTS